METAHIVLVQGDSKYDIQRMVCDRVKTSLEKRNFQVTVADRTEYAQEHLFIQRLEELKPEAIFTMDMTGFECKTLGDEVSYNGIPCRMMHFLPKAPWEYDILNQRYNFTMFFYCTRESDQAVIRQYYERVINIGCLKQTLCREEQKKPYHEREVEVYLPCTYEKSEEIYNRISKLPQVFKTIADYCIREMERQPELLFVQALSDCLDKLEFEKDAESMIEILQELKEVPRYVRMHYLEQLLTELLSKQLRVSVSGQGWKTYANETNEYFHIMGREGVSYEKCEEILKNSKLVLTYAEENRTAPEKMAEEIRACLETGQKKEGEAQNIPERFQGYCCEPETWIDTVLADMELQPHRTV